MSWDPSGLLEKFTERARQVVVVAQEEARELGHNYIGTEHVLLGLLREEEGLAGSQRDRVSRCDRVTFVAVGVIARSGASVRLGQQDDVGIGKQTDPELLAITARLFADMASGARLIVSRATIVGGMPRRGEAAIFKRDSGPPLSADPETRRQTLASYRVQRRDVEDIINSVLGRDPDQIRPFSLSWGPLIKLLEHNGIALTEDELIATPFVFDFSDELLAELAPDAADEA